MKVEHKQVVRETWKQVTPVADAAAAMFYSRLFEIDPTTQPLFEGKDIAEQRRKLVASLTMAVNGLDDLDALVPVIQDLGRRHVDYGVEDMQYDSVGAALLWTLEQGLGEAWTPQAAEAWTEVYQLLAKVMLDAASEHAASAGSNRLDRTA